jgi:hypothetical protein
MISASHYPRRMRSLRLVPVWLLSAILAWCVAPVSMATRVITVQHKCPACEKTFLGQSYSSWFQFQQPARDLAGSLYAAQLRLITCPHCLYSALKMEPLSAAAKRRIVAALKRLPEGLSPIDPAAGTPGGMERPSPSALEATVQFQIAELCHAQVEREPDRDTSFALLAYYRAAPGKEKAAATQRAITALRAVLVDEFVAKQSPAKVYLLGELQRRAGQTKEAVATLTLAAQLARKEENNIAGWAAEQRKLAERGITKAIEEKAPPDEDSDAKLARQLQERLPAFITALQRGRPAREWLLAGRDLHDPVHSTLDAANRLVKDGNARAVEYVLRWLAQIDRAELDDYPEPYCLEALAHQAALGAPILPGLKFRDTRLADATRYACGAAPAPAVTREALSGKIKWLPSDTGVLMVATVRRDPAFKAPLLEKAGGYWPMWRAASYLRELATPADLPAIARRLTGTKHPADVEEFDPRTVNREELEEVMLSVRLRALAAPLLPNPATSR